MPKRPFRSFALLAPAPSTPTLKFKLVAAKNQGCSYARQSVDLPAISFEWPTVWRR